MPISKHFDRKKEMITFTSHGELSFDEVISAIETMYASEDGEYIRDVICDLSNSTLSGMSDEEIFWRGDIISAHRKVRKHVKSALFSRPATPSSVQPKIQLRHSKN